MADGGSAMLRLATRLSCVLRTLGNSITDLLRLVSTGQENGTAARSAPTGARAGSIVTVDFCTALLAASWTAKLLGHDAMMAMHYWSIGMDRVCRNAEACRTGHGLEGWGAFFDGIGDGVYGGQDSFGYASCFWGSMLGLR
ncbi:hypothetical protein VD0002_g3275 [Verticillium dahliae]|nr:hypothetical protein VdG2_01634 [Verticillium dahliae VDG2]KAH6689985.1 hypothetical protein EV126DRAFT_508527 [Verticillium dahliae]PNH30978.1 hypothetical protein BJF96_g5839 [Verticillium dahliae]PNH52609.1 hypothetical protein VD0003_g4721 [Verticillium dahliae]PNH65903.1 hypothetical protein VD0002_g3275 [Verticillium dahliae]